MAEQFDAYYKWLGIPPAEQPADFYRLLGVRQFEDDPDVIANAADQRMGHVRGFQSGTYSAQSQKLLNELAAARVCLLRADKKAQYDASLKQRLAAARPAPIRPAAPPAAVAARPRSIAQALPIQAAAVQAEPSSPEVSVQVEPARSPVMPHQKSAKSNQTLLLACGGGLAILLIAIVGAIMATGGSGDQLADRSKDISPAAETTAVAARPVGGENQPSVIAPAVTDPAFADPTQGNNQSPDPAAADPRPAAGKNDPMPGGTRPVVVVSEDPPRSGDPVEPAESPQPVGTTPDGPQQPTTQSGAPAATPPSQNPASPDPATANKRPLGNGNLSDLLDQANKNPDSTKPPQTAGRNPNTGRPAPGSPEPQDDPSESAPVEPRVAAPDATAQKQAREKIVSIFGSQMTAAKTPSEKGQIAGTLLQTARDTKDAPADRFMLLMLARDCAADAGQTELLMSIVDQIDVWFEVDKLELALESLVLDKRQGPEAYNALISIYDQSLAKDRHDVASKALNVASSIARKANDASLTRDLGVMRKTLTERQKAFQLAEKARATLKTAPDDEESHLVLGRYYCFTLEEFQRGLEHLKRGSDAELKLAAEGELAQPKEAAAQSAVADKWLAIAKKEKSPAKTAMLERAAHWYELARPQLSGLSEAAVKERIAEVGRLMEAEDRAGGSPNAAGFAKLKRMKPEIHVIAISNGEVDPESGLTTANVKVSIKDKPIILVLSSFNQCLWKVQLEEGVYVKQVLLGGYYQQGVVGLMPRTPVVSFTRYGGNAPGGAYFYSYYSGSFREADMISDIVAFTGLPIAKLQYPNSARDIQVAP